MKIKNILIGTMFAGLAASASAQTTEITITGATAFRQAAMRAIYDAYALAGAAGTTFNVAHDFNGANISQLIASNKAIFSGTFPGITGTTVIRTSFNGSTEGLNAIAGNNNPSFLTAAALTSGNFTAGIKDNATGTETLRPKFSFSDVYQSTSPVDTDLNNAPIALNPVGSSAVGIVTFCMIANEGAPSDLDNVTIQQCRKLWETGILPLSLFTGDPSDHPTHTVNGTLSPSADAAYVLATGRNDGSGTRAAYLTEWTFGVANLVNQYTAVNGGTSSSGNGSISKLTLVPANGIGNGTFSTNRTSDASTLWGNTNVGNGGYSSSSALRTLMGYTSSNVTIYNGVDQAPDFENQKVVLLTWLSTADSLNASTNGAKILGYNGVKVTPVSSGSYANSGFNEADFKKIATGAYSAWSYQHLYYHGSLSAAEQTWYDAMKATYLPSGLQITSNGVRLEDVTVSRSDDGFPIVAPL
jgi:hypothetical protein